MHGEERGDFKPPQTPHACRPDMYIMRLLERQQPVVEAEKHNISSSKITSFSPGTVVASFLQPSQNSSAFSQSPLRGGVYL